MKSSAMNKLQILLLFGILFQFASSVQIVDRTSHAKLLKYSIHREPKFNDEKSSDDAVAAAVETKWITQPLNHFNPQDNRTFEMRYMENDEYLEQDGPIFIYVGGEWTITSGRLASGHVHDMARELKGMLFYTEHRYYGQTRPTPDLSLENLRYLNVDQALADLANFIVQMKRTNPMLTNSGVILVGGSYSASEVTWFMQKYPHLAHGAWASSAPLQAKVDFTEYKEIVDFAIKLVGRDDCANLIESGFKQLEQWIVEGNSPAVEESMSLCYPLNVRNKLDVELLLSTIAEAWSGIVQYHSERYQDIQEQCKVLLDSNQDNPAFALGDWFWNEYYENDIFDQCLDHRFSSWLASFQHVNYTASIWRQWQYQSCAEYGWFQTSGNGTIFGTKFPLGTDLEICHEAYNFPEDKVHANARRTNVIYGSYEPNVKHVYSTHGQLDPWRAMGVQSDINAYSPTFVLPLEAHCSDLSSISDSDLPETRESKERVFEHIKSWLAEPTPAAALQ